MKGHFFIREHDPNEERNFPRLTALYLLAIFIFILPLSSFSQIDSSYDETIITVAETNIGKTDMSAIIHHEDIYLPVKEIFDFLSIYNTPSAANNDNLTGFYISPPNRYVFNVKTNQIIYRDSIIPLGKNDLILSYGRLFLRSDYFEKIFGLTCTFRFRSLSVVINSKNELPAVREKRQQLMRQNIASLNAVQKADTIIRNSFSMFRFGAADWQLTTTNIINGENNVRANLNLGAIVAGGEANVFLNYNSGIPLKAVSQFYSWRYINNNNTIVRQINLGRVFTNSTSSLIAPLNGFRISNTPTTYKKSFGTFTVSNTTEPNWIVELYVNDILVNYTKADAAGFFSFEVPMVYGSSRIKYKFYGPYGEEMYNEQYINIPFTFLPENQFEYALTGGIVSDDERSRFSRANVNYGVSNRFTVGTGVEYLSSVESGQAMPFVNASLRVGSSLILSGEHTYNVVTRATANYRLPNDIQLDLNYAKYVPGQTAIKLSAIEEKKAVFSMPVRTNFLRGFSRLSINRVTYPYNKSTHEKNTFTTADLMLTAVVGRISSNITTYAGFTPVNPILYSKASITFQLPKGIRITPQVQYEYRQQKFSILRSEFEKRVFKAGFINFTVERNRYTKSTILMAGIRLNLSFAQTAFTIRQYDQSMQLIQSSGGGLVFNSYTGDVMATSQASVGKGGLIIAPFLDYNCNGVRDQGEPGISGLIARVPMGQIFQNKTDTIIRVRGLEAYNKYYISLDKNSFDNPAWKIRNKIIEFTAVPNDYKLVEVPVTVMGEVSGMVYKMNAREGIGGIIVNIFNDSNQLVAKTLSEPDGYFSYMGLPAGSYKISVDKDQLAKINMNAGSAPVTFTIVSKKDGDIVDGIELYLSDRPAEIIEDQTHL